MHLDLIGAILLGFNSAIVIGTLALGLGSTLGGRLRTAALLAAWLGIVIALGATGALHPEDADPQNVRLAATAKLGIAVGLPIALMVAAVLSIRSLKERVLSLPMTTLVGLNSIRVLGVLFLLLSAAGQLAAPFALAAGWGDILVGAISIPVAFATRHHENRGLLIAWAAIGLADLINAVGLGVTTSLTSAPGAVGTGPMTLLPWLLIPIFLVPLFFATHLAVLYKALRSGSASRRPVFA